MSPTTPPGDPGGATTATGGAGVVPAPFDALRTQLTEAAATFADGPGALEGILLGMVQDVERALAEPLEIFPVCHHSPASATAMARRLREKQPAVIYLELCEDMAELLPELRHCTLPVALQAFAGRAEGFAPEWAPLSVVAPLTEASAEYQAIAYALTTPGVQLVCVDRSADHVFQWEPPGDEPGKSAWAGKPAGPGKNAKAGTGPGAAGDAEETALHGDAVGVEIGDLRPRFAELEEHLVRHGRVRHWSEWWHQYVEVPLGDADHDTYRQAMCLVGSLMRRLAPGGTDRLRIDEDRERFMWTRIRAHLRASGIEAARGMYVCGAFHAVSHVPEFGTGGTDTFEITPPTATTWQYGLIPSSHRAIEAQFALAPGTVSIAASTWTKNLRRTRTKPWRLAAPSRRAKAADAAARTADGAGAASVRTGIGVVPSSGIASSAEDPASATRAVTPAVPPARTVPPAHPDQLTGFLRRPPVLDALDEAELLKWSVAIVAAARRAGYLASTADAIAVFETAIGLAAMRERANPTPYDFQDAAVTCIEKDAVPGRRDVASLVATMLGADRRGTVGYEALPPLARDVYDRLAPLGLDIDRRGVKRALLDLRAHPELAACSDVLWRLRYLMPPGTARPIMGERRLGVRSIQESWDLAVGTNQRALIELGYEGVSLEQVLEQRLRRAAWTPGAGAADALGAVEDTLVLLDNRRLADELGERALDLLTGERDLDSAPRVLRATRRLLAHYRTVEPILPVWIESFVATGYAHYCTLLPTAFTDEDTAVEQVGAALGFLLGMEPLALSLGCDRGQLELAVAQCHPQDPERLALLWAVQVQLGSLTRAQLRERFTGMLTNPLLLGAYPRYLRGLVQALEPVPSLTSFVVETLSRAFGALPDAVLLPWLPGLVVSLRESEDLAAGVVREAERTFPTRPGDLDTWVPPWAGPTTAGRPPAAPSGSSGPMAQPAAPTGLGLLRAHPAACDALARLLGAQGKWATVDAAPDSSGGADAFGGAGSADGFPSSGGADSSGASASSGGTDPGSGGRTGAAVLAAHPACATALAALLGAP